MNISAVLDILTKVSNSKSVKAGKWGAIGTLVGLLAYWGPDVYKAVEYVKKNREYVDYMEEKKPQLDSIPIYVSMIQVKQEGFDEYLQGITQVYDNRLAANEAKIELISKRELMKDPLLKAETDKRDTVGAILYETNGGDLWFFDPDGWVFSAHKNKAEDHFWYTDLKNKRKSIQNGTR